MTVDGTESTTPGTVVLLFDIDGTLVRCGGAGGQALRAALAEEFSITVTQPVRMAGRTDRGIFNELLALHRLEPSDHNRRRLGDRYVALLPGYLQQLRLQAKAYALPGVHALLSALVVDARFQVALLTGNLPATARIKLEQFALWSYFRWGIFGGEAEHRPELAAPALESVSRYCGDPGAARRIVVIGDTPLDVELAASMGARSIAVATGEHTADELRGVGADHVLLDLADTGSVLQLLHER